LHDIVHRLALDIGVDPRRINEIVLGKRSVTANTALRLARYFKTSPEFWMGLQAQYDLDVEEVEERKVGRMEEGKSGRVED
jgi:addiction module HigA family antidote